MVLVRSVINNVLTFLARRAWYFHCMIWIALPSPDTMKSTDTDIVDHRQDWHLTQWVACTITNFNSFLYLPVNIYPPPLSETEEESKRRMFSLESWLSIKINKEFICCKPSLSLVGVILSFPTTFTLREVLINFVILGRVWCWRELCFKIYLDIFNKLLSKVL